MKEQVAIFYYPFLVMGTLVLPKWIATKNISKYINEKDD